MKKVVFAIRKVKDFDNKISGLGCITDDETLIQKYKRPNGEKSYRVFPDVEQRCFPILNKQNEYKGYVTKYFEYDGRDIEVEYSVWYEEEWDEMLYRQGRTFYAYAYVWNKTDDYCSEFGTIGIRSFGGGIKRVA